MTDTDLNAASQAETPAADKKIQRFQARAAEKRTDRHDAIETWAQKQRLIRADRQAERAERRELRAEKRAERNSQARRAKAIAGRLAEQFLVTAPILAPMAVAWTGQSEFAMRVLGWVFTASVLYAAAYELTTVYCAWLYHQARSDGDSGWEYRLGTWIFATGAAVQQWWHYSDHWHPTPRAVTYSVMSIVGVLLWEGRARLIHRRKLRAEGKQPPARPKIGLARWIRYPIRSWTAWSLITLEGHETLKAAWAAADEELTAKQMSATKASQKAAIEAPRTASAEHPAAAIGGAPKAPLALSSGRPGSATTAPSAAAQSAPTAAAMAPPPTAQGAPQGATVSLVKRHQSATQGAPVNLTKRHQSAPAGASVAPTKAPRPAATKRPKGNLRDAARDAIKALYETNQKRPLESEMVAALKAAKLPHSRQFANARRLEIEKDDPALAALGSQNVRPLTGS